MYDYYEAAKCDVRLLEAIVDKIREKYNVQ